MSCIRVKIAVQRSMVVSMGLLCSMAVGYELLLCEDGVLSVMSEDGEKMLYVKRS